MSPDLRLPLISRRGTEAIQATAHTAAPLPVLDRWRSFAVQVGLPPHPRHLPAPETG
jgi:hypothetical protein